MPGSEAAGAQQQPVLSPVTQQCPEAGQHSKAETTQYQLSRDPAAEQQRNSSGTAGAQQHHSIEPAPNPAESQQRIAQTQQRPANVQYRFSSDPAATQHQCGFDQAMPSGDASNDAAANQQQPSSNPATTEQQSNTSTAATNIDTHSCDPAANQQLCGISWAQKLTTNINGY